MDNWPRLVQLTYLYYDRSGNLISQKNFIIRPYGFVIPADSSRIHGITPERARSDAVSLVPVLEHFRQLVAGADCLVTHNMSFDEKNRGAEFLRVQLPNSLTGKRKICTMESATDFYALLGGFCNLLFSSSFQGCNNPAN